MICTSYSSSCHLHSIVLSSSKTQKMAVEMERDFGLFHSMLWHCWLGNRKGIWLCKNLGVGLLVVTIWLELSTSYNTSCHYLHHSCSNKIQNGDILVPGNPGLSGKLAVKTEREIVEMTFRKLADGTTLNSGQSSLN